MIAVLFFVFVGAAIGFLVGVAYAVRETRREEQERTARIMRYVRGAR